MARVLKKIIKTDDGKQRPKKNKGDILLLSKYFFNDNKINKATDNKMFSWFMSSARMNALEDA